MAVTKLIQVKQTSSSFAHFCFGNCIIKGKRKVSIKTVTLVTAIKFL